AVVQHSPLIAHGHDRILSQSHPFLRLPKMPPAMSPAAFLQAYRPPSCGPALLFVPGPTLPERDGLADMPLLPCADPELIPVVVPFLMCLVVPVAPGPTLPSLDAPGAGCICARAPPVDSAIMQAEAIISFFMLNSCGWDEAPNRRCDKAF